MPAGATATGRAPVVGLVASAGGLEPLKRFFQSLPPGSGMSFIVVPHLHPQRESVMPQLLARHAAVPVTEAADGMPVEIDHAYVIPPNAAMSIEQGCLRLHPLGSGHGSTAIDPFLRSLAADRQECAACVVLSGTGAHGALGLKAVKEAGGIALVQDPSTAEYPQMPENAIATGLADVVAPAEELPASLIRYARHLAGVQVPEAGKGPGDSLTQLLAIIRARSRFDFRAYRKPMLMRRVRRRMSLLRIDSLPDYIALLRNQADEVKQLCRDLLISVTSFFRDEAMFETLAEQVLPALLTGRDRETPLRVWVPGCATGEEAYSLAILLIEAAASAQVDVPIQIFATDVDADAIEVARRGVYRNELLADVSPPRMREFFSRVDDKSWEVSKQLREMVRFAPHNLLSDAPFSRLDLVSCRNVLIYLEPEFQSRVLLLFHFGLNDGGYLVLGPSEGLGRRADLFSAVSKKWRIFRRVASARRERADFPLTGGERRAGLARAEAAGDATSQRSLAEVATQALVREFAPPAVLVDRNLQVLHFAGSAAPYLQQPAGAPTADVIALAHPGLRAKLRAALQRALHDHERVSLTIPRFRRDDAQVGLQVAIIPQGGARGGATTLLVAFQEASGSRRARRAAAPSPADETLIEQLEHELKSSREDLQSTIEELESANEELKASNEEISSMNEELQSANEELETSKEELQSLNEELVTVNGQLRDKVDELESTNDDMTNLLASSDVATIFLGADRRIRRFTPASMKLFNLIPSDVGRPIGDITARFEDASLVGDIDGVLKSLTPAQAEVRSDDGRWFLRRVQPYRTTDNRIEGVVVSFSDIGSVKESEQVALARSRELARRVEERTSALESESSQRAALEDELREERDFVTTILDTTSALVAVVDTKGRAVRFNHACERASGWQAADVIGRDFSELGLIPDDEIDRVRAAVGKVVESGQAVELESRWRRRDGSECALAWVNAPLADDRGRVHHIVASAVDVTERNRALAELRAERDLSHAILDTTPAIILVSDPQARVVVFNRAAQRTSGRSLDDVKGKEIFDLVIPADERPRAREVFRKLAEGADELSAETDWLHQDGSRRRLSWLATALRDGDGRVKLVIGAAVDITARLAAETQARERLVELSRLHRVHTAGELATVLAHEINQPLAAISSYAAAGSRAGEAEGGRARELFTKIGDAAMRAGRVVHDLRAFVSPRPASAAAIDLVAVVRSSIELLVRYAKLRGVEIAVEAARLPQVAADPVQVQHIVINLVRNGIEAIVGSGEATGKVTVRLLRDGNMAHMIVEDTGPGIGETDLAAIFRPFHSTKADGLGMGLRISRSLAEANSGKLWAEAHAPGARLHVHLPLAP